MGKTEFTTLMKQEAISGLEHPGKCNEVAIGYDDTCEDHLHTVLVIMIAAAEKRAVL